MAKRNIQVTIKELSAPIDARIRKSREDLIDLLEDITYPDIGKMYDQFGNPVEPHLLGRGECMAIAGFEFPEDFIGVRGGSKKKDGNDSDDTKQMAAGYTKKYKHVDRLKYLITYAKMLGYISDEPSTTDDELKSLTIAS